MHRLLVIFTQVLRSCEFGVLVFVALAGRPILDGPTLITHYSV